MGRSIPAAPPPPGEAPRPLVVVGAAAGMGRWLVEHLLGGRPWTRTVLVDVPSSQAALEALAASLGPHVEAAVVVETDAGPIVRGAAAGHPVPPVTDDAAVCLAVPPRAVASVSRWLAPLVAGGGSVCAISERQGPMLEQVAEHLPGATAFGLHPLFDSSARTADGQTFVLLPRADEHRWMAELVEASGGITRTISPTEHDEAMTYVQAMTHHALVAFMDGATRSGHDLELLWELRTPLFEALFGLGVRAIAERQQPVLAEIQASPDGARVAAELDAAARTLAAAAGSGDPAEVEAVIAAVRERFSGSLFETIGATAHSAVSAAQAKRAELARHRRLATLVGVRPVGRPDALRVGRIEAVTPVSVTLREEMFGEPGGAALVDEAGRRNARRVGISRTPKATTFGLGHIEVVTGAELEDELDRWLASIARDIRFLVPESVAGAGVLAIVANHEGIRAAEVVSEVVRTGQRSVVVRVAIRVDHDVDDMVEELRSRVQDAYVWPPGIVLDAPQVRRVHYLGPAGTFSEGAARQAVESAGVPHAELVALDDFGAVLDAIGPDSLGILPISSSASGLVSRAVQALLDHRTEVVVGGVVDVAVRFDAYIRTDRQLDQLRGARVHSHPQALGQCQSFIKRWGLVATPTSSTTEALAVVAADPEGSVALARADADTSPALKVAEREIDDLSGSITRFLILGGPATFGRLSGGWDPTLRHVWVARRAQDLLEHAISPAPTEAGFDEILTSSVGEALWVTSRSVPSGQVAGARHLGRAPWSPRTPLVRVEVEVVPD